MSNNDFYFQKYIKYKTKYLSLISQQQGGANVNGLVFDFDNTITKFQLIINIPFESISNYKSYVDQRTEDILSDLFKYSKFINNLRKFKNKGNYIGIASYGYKDVIKYVLDKFNLRDIFNDYILTPADFGLKEAVSATIQLDGKNKMIKTFQQQWNIMDKHKIMLVDDSEPNILRALKEGFYAIKSNEYGLIKENQDVLNKFMNGIFKPSSKCTDIINIEGQICPPK